MNLPQILLKYNADFFGSNIAADENITFTANGILDTADYAFTATDLEADYVELKLSGKGALDADSLTTLTTEEQLLTHIKIGIENPTTLPDAYIDTDSMQHNSKYVEDTDTLPFDTVIVEENLEAFLTLVIPQIDTFYPDTLRAGICDTLTIIGDDFGNQKDNSRVLFTDAHRGPPFFNNLVAPLDSEYVYWSDDTIMVRVSSLGFFNGGANLTTDAYPGTGFFEVNKGGGIVTLSPKKLVIKYAARNSFTEPTWNPPNSVLKTYVTDNNNDGGFDLYYSGAFSKDQAAKDAFERALKTWRCATLVNINVRGLC